MAKTSFFLELNGLTRFKAPVFTPEQVVGIGGFAIDRLQTRVDKGLDADDQPAAPYSPRGPIYIPISGVGTIVPRRGKTGIGANDIIRSKKLSVGEKAKALAVLRVKRNKTTLGGREVFTAKDIAKLRKSPKVLIVAKGKPSGQISGKILIVRTKKSLKFANWSQYKQALGHPAYRDLSLSGRMRGAIAIVVQNPSSVEIGFTREIEHQKALGNQAIDPWFGLSPSDKKWVVEQVKDRYMGAVVKGML